MTTEDDFQAALDAKPDDWQTRLVFADWLDERGDPRAEGYRALGVLRLVPLRPAGENRAWYARADSAPATWLLDPESQARKYYPTQNLAAAILPGDWFDVVELLGKGEGCAPRFTDRSDCSLAELDGAVALAFAKLPAARRAELLAAGTPA